MAIDAETICMMLQIFAISDNYGNILPPQLNVINNNVHSDGIYILIQIVDDAKEEALLVHIVRKLYVVHNLGIASILMSKKVDLKKIKLC